MKTLRQIWLVIRKLIDNLLEDPEIKRARKILQQDPINLADDPTSEVKAGQGLPETLTIEVVEK